MGFLDKAKELAAKATDMVGEHSESLQGGIDKAGEFAKDKIGRDEQVDKGVQAAKDGLDKLSGQ